MGGLVRLALNFLFAFLLGSVSLTLTASVLAEARNHFFEGGRFDEMLGFGELLVAAVLILYVLLPLTVIGLFTQALRFTRTRDKRV